MIRILLLAAAVAGGGVLLKTIHDQKQPLTLEDAADKAGDAVKTTSDAIDKAGRMADAVTTSAQKGVQATDSAWRFVTNAANSVSARIDEFNKPAPKPPASAPTASPSSSKGLPHAKSDARKVLPLDQVVPQSAAVKEN